MFRLAESLSRFTRSLALSSLLAVALAATPLEAADTSASPEERIEALEKALAETRAELAAARASGGETRLAEAERRIELLATEIAALKIGEAAAPSEPTAKTGLAPAASKVYGLKRGVSVGGYGEILFENLDSEREDGAPSGRTDRIDMLRAIVYFGYKFDDRFVFNSEIEYEHGITSAEGDGEVAVEFAYLDWMHSPALNLRSGLVLVPMGFVNELHEPPVYLGARRPMVERLVIPATWRELGFGAWGDLGPVSYRAYLVNGLDSAGYSGTGIRGGRQGGSVATAEDWALTGRLDWTATPGLLAGVAVFSGDSAQGRRTPDGESFDGRTTVVDLHAEARLRGFQLRGLWVAGRVGDADRINEANGLVGSASVGSRQSGWYGEAGWDVLSLRAGGSAALVPFVRYEEWDTQEEVPDGWSRNPSRDSQLLTVGVSFKPIENIVLKADWQKSSNEGRTGIDQWNLALGWLF